MKTNKSDLFKTFLNKDHIQYAKHSSFQISSLEENRHFPCALWNNLETFENR